MERNEVSTDREMHKEDVVYVYLHMQWNITLP